MRQLPRHLKPREGPWELGVVESGVFGERSLRALQHDEPEWRNRQGHRVLEPVHRVRARVDAAAIAHVAPAIDLAVAVEDLAIPAAFRDAEPVALPRHGREI